MARIHGVAGEWARVRGTVLGLWPLFLGIFSAGFAVALMLAYAFYGLLLLIVSLIGISASLMFGLRRIERFFKGARGEEKVAGVLAGLPDGFHVFNDFKAGSAFVDHVVLGPTGVFSIETKCWSGEVTVEEGSVLVNGRLPSRDPIPQAVKESDLVRGSFAAVGWKGKVVPILVFASDNFRASAIEVGGAVIMNSSGIVGAITSGSQVLSESEVRRLVSIIES
mgnify:CR=1 FL=1